MNRDEQAVWDAFVQAESGGSWLDDYERRVALYNLVTRPKQQAVGRWVRREASNLWTRIKGALR